MSRWTHAICEACWYHLRDYEPVCMNDAAPKRCCYCTETTSEGIYVRDDPEIVTCRGKEGIHVEDEP